MKMTALARVLVVSAVAVLLCGSAVQADKTKKKWLNAGTVGNQLIVKFGVPGFAFHALPRTLADAQQSSWEKALDRADDKTTVWCPKGDHRVCLLFDQQGSVAGIQISVPVQEIRDSKVPLVLEEVPEWTTQEVLGVKVYSLITFFVPKEVLLQGGRSLTKETLTAPEGVFFLQTDKNGVETGRLHMGTEEALAEGLGFHKQRCFTGMGTHYYQGVTKESTCEAYRPYFTLYNPKTSKLHGFGFNMYGKPDRGRWMESTTALAHKFIVPNEPECTSEWVNKYGLFALHVYFVEQPYFTWCLL